MLILYSHILAHPKYPVNSIKKVNAKKEVTALSCILTLEFFLLQWHSMEASKGVSSQAASRQLLLAIYGWLH